MAPADVCRIMRDAALLPEAARGSKRTPWRTVVAVPVLAAAVWMGADLQGWRAAPFEFVRGAHAQQTDTVVPPASVAGAMAPVDEAFALFLASSSLAEIEGARVVLKSTKNAEVVEFAQKLIRDHQRASDELRRIVEPRGVKLPAAPTGRHADMVTKLAGVAPPERDEAFMQRFGIDAHKEAITLTERHVREGKDTMLRRFAEQTLATLREHMAAASKVVHAAAGR